MENIKFPVVIISIMQGYLKNLLITAKVKWHKMLLLTYKDIYVRNRNIFDDFFSALDKYYVSGDVDLDKSFNLFFQRIQNTMFVLIDKRLANKQGFLNCTSKHIADIKPFGRYQVQIATQLRSSLVQARTFVVGLQAGSNVTASVINYLSRNECREGFTKIQHCSLCEGIPNALVCNATCHNLLYSCFSLDPLLLDKLWGDYIRGVHALSAGLDGQFGIEAVVGQLAYAISSAIMEFQTNFITVLAKAQTLCPMGSRRKRAVDKSGSDLYLVGERVRRSQDSLISLSSGTKQQPQTLFTFTTAFRKQLDEIKDVWRDLPKTICSKQTFVSRNHNESCWNGIEMQKASVQVPRLKLNSGDGHSRRLIVGQLLNLRQIVENNEIPEVVSEEKGDESGCSGGSGSGDGSASGSGVGSGCEPTESGDPDTTVEVPGVTSRPSTTDQTFVISATDQSTSIGSSTDEIYGSGTDANYVTTPTSVINKPSIDDEDTNIPESSGSPTEYITTPRFLVNKPTIDDEDMEISGSGNGENETMTDIPRTDGEILFNPTTHEDVIVKAIFGTKGVDKGPGGEGNMIVMSYLSLLFVILVGIMNM